MKKFISTLLVCIASFTFVFAQSNENDVSMVSYEQSWLDYEGTLALKNNTQEDIHNVSFQIVYTDMSGNPLDYEDFVKKVDIAPGMTRKLDIPAYEHSRHYHYYKSKGAYGEKNTAFKIEFKLKGYNLENAETEDDIDLFDDYKDTYDGPRTGMIILMIVAALLIFAAVIGMYILVAVLAKKRNRNVALWVLLSIFASPLLIIIILLVIGNDDAHLNELR